MVLAVVVTKTKVDVGSLFPKRLKQKVPFWSVAGKDTNCAWCQDDILLGERVVFDPNQKGTFCLQCGDDVMLSSAAKPSLEKCKKETQTVTGNGHKVMLPANWIRKR